MKENNCYIPWFLHVSEFGEKAWSSKCWRLPPAVSTTHYSHVQYGCVGYFRKEGPAYIDKYGKARHWPGDRQNNYSKKTQV